MVKHYYRRTRAASNRSIERKKPTAATQKKQILALNQKVNANSRKLEGVRYKVSHSTRLALNIEGTVPNPYKVLPLNAPSNMLGVFSDPEEQKGGKYNMDGRGRFNLVMNISTNTEPTPMPLSVFIVSPKNSKVAVSLGINVGGTAFNLINGTDYVNNLAAGTYMNPKRFNIHKHWLINLNPIVTLGGTTPWQGDLHPIRKTFSMKNPLKLNSRTGVWSATADEAVNPNQRLFLIVFNNNTGTPGTYPVLNGMVLSTAFTSE